MNGPSGITDSAVTSASVGCLHLVVEVVHRRGGYGPFIRKCLVRKHVCVRKLISTCGEGPFINKLYNHTIIMLSKHKL